MATFDERLRELRAGKNISQQKLGEFVGVTRWAVCNYETGKNYPDFKCLMKLADYFEVSLDYLTGRSDVRGVQ